MASRRWLLIASFALSVLPSVASAANPVDIRSGWFHINTNLASSVTQSFDLVTVPAGYTFVLTDFTSGYPFTAPGSIDVQMVAFNGGPQSLLTPQFPVNTPISMHMTTGLLVPAGQTLRAQVNNHAPTSGSIDLEFGFAGYMVSNAVSSVAPQTPGPLLGMSVHPNPSSGSAEVQFTLSRAGSVGLSIFDAGGRRVARIHPERLAAGPHVFLWDGRMADGSLSPPGVYMARLEGDGVKGMKQVVVER